MILLLYQKQRSIARCILVVIICITEGYKIITVGSSSGGFAAVYYGQLLRADTIYTFNGQFEVDSLLIKSSKDVDPILFRNQYDSSLRPYYDIRKFIKQPSNIYYFRSTKSNWDVEQHNHIKDLDINVFSFTTSHHGIPFAKTALPKVLNMELNALRKYKSKKIHPLIFSVKVAGLGATIKEVISVFKKLVKQYLG